MAYKDFVFLPLWLLFLDAEIIKGEEGCKHLEYLPCIKNKQLKGHVISTSRVSAPGYDECQANCFKEDKCLSYNMEPVVGQTRTCELNEFDHVISAVMNSEGFEYCPIKNPCSSNPCKAEAGSFCVPDFYWDSFSCRFGCVVSSALGMEDGRIRDNQISASYEFEDNKACQTKNARLNQKIPVSSAWCGDRKNAYIEIDFRSKKTVTKIATQGRHISPQWVEKYLIEYKNDKGDWVTHRKPKYFIGNVDNVATVNHSFPIPIRTRYIRLVALKFNILPSLRLELYGC